jgi:hypothetical protein
MIGWRLAIAPQPAHKGNFEILFGSIPLKPREECGAKQEGGLQGEGPKMGGGGVVIAWQPEFRHECGREPPPRRLAHWCGSQEYAPRLK